jgi:hypothetical protein
MTWPLANPAIVLCWLLVGVLVVWLMNAEPDSPESLGSMFAVVAVWGAWSYIPYLIFVSLLPRAWSRRTKRLIAVMLSPLVGWFAAGFLPEQIFFGVAAGFTVILPERMGLRVARPAPSPSPVRQTETPPL